MVLDPLTTFVVYMIAILVLFTCIAALADWLEVKADRKARDQARAEARAKRREERDTSHVEWH